MYVADMRNRTVRINVYIHHGLQGVDKAVGATIVTGGKMASITYTIEAQTPEEWRILGSDGMIVFTGPAHAPRSMQVTTAGATRMDPPTTYTVTPDPPVLIPNANALNFPGSEGFVYQAQGVVSAHTHRKRASPAPAVRQSRQHSIYLEFFRHKQPQLLDARVTFR